MSLVSKRKKSICLYLHIFKFSNVPLYSKKKKKNIKKIKNKEINSFLNVIFEDVLLWHTKLFKKRANKERKICFLFEN